MSEQPGQSAERPKMTPYDDQAYDDQVDCTHCGGDGMCWDGADPLGDCPDEIHNCHACGGTGNREDQAFF